MQAALQHGLSQHTRSGDASDRRGREWGLFSSLSPEIQLHELGTSSLGQRSLDVQAVDRDLEFRRQ